MLDELERPGSGTGRRRAALARPADRCRCRLAPRAAFAIGLDFGHRHVRAAVCDLAGQRDRDALRRRSQVDERPGSECSISRTSCRATGCATAGTDRPTCSGSASGSRRRSTPSSGTRLRRRHPRALARDATAAELQRRLELPGEARERRQRRRAGRASLRRGDAASSDLAYVRLSAGVGLGLILDGAPYRGRLGIAGELGHVVAVARRRARCAAAATAGAWSRSRAPPRSPTRWASPCRGRSSSCTRATRGP